MKASTSEASQVNSGVMVFDSGIGGLTVAKEILRRTPDVSIHYVMDDEAFPYGTRSDEYLSARIPQVCIDAVSRLNPAILVVACNTASTLALDILRGELSIPVVGVVPAIKVAAERARNGVIGVLATPATVNRPYIHRLIEQFASDCEVKLLGSSELVYWAEQSITTGKLPDPESIRAHLQDWLSGEQCPSHVVLGCTHFPVFRELLSDFWPDIDWIDSGEAIARRVEYLLDHHKLNPGSARADQRIQLTTTSGRQISAALLKHIAGWSLAQTATVTK